MKKNEDLYNRTKKSLEANPERTEKKVDLNELRNKKAAVHDKKVNSELMLDNVQEMSDDYVKLLNKKKSKLKNLKVELIELKNNFGKLMTKAWNKIKGPITKVAAVSALVATLYGVGTNVMNKNQNYQDLGNNNNTAVTEKASDQTQNKTDTKKATSVTNGDNNNKYDAQNIPKNEQIKSTKKSTQGLDGNTEKQKVVEGSKENSYKENTENLEDKQVIEDAKKDQNKEVKDLNENVTSVTKKDNTTEQKKAPENNYEKKEETKVEVKEEKTQEVKSQEKQEKSEAKAYSNEIDTQQQKAKEDQQKQQADLDDWLMGR